MKSMSQTENFIDKNKAFWLNFNNIFPSKNLLIEEPSKCFITHVLATQSLVLCKARSYKPVWMYSKNSSLELLRSYNPRAEYVKIPGSIFFSMVALLKAIPRYLKMVLSRKIISFTYDNIKYGDIIYDSYLSLRKVGTVKQIDLAFLYLIYSCIKRHDSVRRLIKTHNIDAVLASHRIGIRSGALVRASLRSGCVVYTSAGIHRNTLYKSEGLNEMIEYEYAPTNRDIEKIVSLNDVSFDQLYESVHDFHINGNCSMDAKYAFSSEKGVYKKKEIFNADFKLDPNKKNIFVMLHAFTDHPHSHFKWMIFKDYADWFLKTLEYAKTDNSVNWIFKRHPSDKFYPTKDIDFKELFKNASKHILFLDTDDKIDTRSLLNVADAIVTCLGSAGFEIPAMGGIPSITAADNHYTGLGFSMNPKTTDEYFKILGNLKNIEKLNSKQQKMAKAAYMFIYYLSSVNSTVNPVLTMEDHHSKDFDSIFFDKVIELYDSKKELIFKEIEENISQVSKKDFKALRTPIENGN